MSRRPQKFAAAFAVVRIDGPLGSSMTDVEIAERITIKKVVATENEAEAEVTRLNQLERDRPENRRAPGRFYFSQYTRLFVEPEHVAIEVER